MRDSKFHLNGLYFEKDLIHFELFSFEIKKKKKKMPRLKHLKFKNHPVALS